MILVSGPGREEDIWVNEFCIIFTNSSDFSTSISFFNKSLDSYRILTVSNKKEASAFLVISFSIIVSCLELSNVLKTQQLTITVWQLRE